MDTPQLSDNALDPKLSPLHNPILAENLDRWARVYAAAPPEFRSRAIQDLLRDLQAEGGFRVAPREESEVPSTFQSVEIACPQCGKMKEREQKFCGFCGAEFQSRAPNSDLADRPAANPFPSLKPMQPAPYASRELDSLRELSFSTIYGAEESHHNGAKYAFVVLVILVCLGALGFTQWRTQIRAVWNRVVTPTATSSPAQANNASAPLPAPSTPQAASASPEPGPENSSALSQPAASDAQQQGSAPADVHEQAPVANPEPNSGQANSDRADSDQASSNLPATPAKHASRVPVRRPVTPASQLEPVKAPASSAPPLDNGSEELSVAQRYLNGTSGARDPSMAATWLWKAVSKQNPTALVLLSDLYAHGEGVSRNCDQARLLLVAAAKKGAPDAGLKLRNFENGGCR